MACYSTFETVSGAIFALAQMPGSRHIAGMVTASEPQGIATAPESAPISPPAKPRHKITAQDVEAIARLITTRRMTDGEACAQLGIKPESWYSWKSSNKGAARNTAMLAQARAAAIDMHVKNMEDGAIGAGAHKRADWRASHALLGLIDSLRYGQQQAQAPVQSPGSAPTTVNVWIDLAYAKPAPGQVVDVQAKQITDSAPSDKTVQK
jgi:predicted DNA-binding protein (UPF0251 family)